jgi:hypothetical protein
MPKSYKESDGRLVKSIVPADKPALSIEILCETCPKYKTCNYVQKDYATKCSGFPDKPASTMMTDEFYQKCQQIFKDNSGGDFQEFGNSGRIFICGCDRPNIISEISTLAFAAGEKSKAREVAKGLEDNNVINAFSKGGDNLRLMLTAEYYQSLKKQLEA